jgi:hypothetical protein
MFAMSRGPRYSEHEAREAIARSISYSEALRWLGMRVAGGNHATLKRYAEEIWQIPTDHFDPTWVKTQTLLRRERVPLDQILVRNSSFSRGHLKRRLYLEGLKERRCELCGQGELWRGRRMSLILDHANGVADDNRLENLRIVCPNCAATLDTHCGRNAPLKVRHCARCSAEFHPRGSSQRYCSQRCGAGGASRGVSRPSLRKVRRPLYEQLLADAGRMSMLAVGRKYGVSDNAVRKWLRAYERERRSGAVALP